METACYSMGILCLLYYVAMICYTKNKRTNFAVFWLLAYLFLSAAGYISRSLPGWGIVLMQALFAVAFVIFLAVEIVIMSAMITIPKKKLPVIIVLGACIRGSELTGSLKRRLDKALEYLHANPETLVIVSGGQGKGEAITEAEAMKRYLLGCGVEEERIIKEDQSRSTEENLRNSLSYMANDKEAVGIVTNNFHMYRAAKLADFVGYRKVTGISAGSDLVLFLNYMVREFFAVLYMYFRFGRKRKETSIDK